MTFESLILPPVLLALAVVHAPARRSADDANQQILQQLEAAWNTAHLRGDAAALDRLFADDIVIVVPGMRVMSKADALGVFASGRMKFDRYETSETTCRVYGDSAIVVGRLRRTRTRGNTTVDDDWRFTKVYVRRADGWRVVSFHASDTTG